MKGKAIDLLQSSIHILLLAGLISSALAWNYYILIQRSAAEIGGNRQNYVEIPGDGALRNSIPDLFAELQQKQILMFLFTFDVYSTYNQRPTFEDHHQWLKNDFEL